MKILKSHIYIPIMLCALSVKAQGPDTVICNAIYSAAFSYEYKEPLFVTYKLYKGGGNCRRTSFRFGNDAKLNCASDKDYKGSGYNRGHLANAEDFAGDCINEKITFMYYNALPQTPNLNRGIWKAWETRIRNESQNDSLLITCGGFFNSQSKRLVGGAAVPDTCWKVVQSLTKLDNNGNFKVLYALIFTNDILSKIIFIDMGFIEKRLGFSIPRPD